MLKIQDIQDSHTGDNGSNTVSPRVDFHVSSSNELQAQSTKTGTHLARCRGSGPRQTRMATECGHIQEVGSRSQECDELKRVVVPTACISTWNTLSGTGMCIPYFEVRNPEKYEIHIFLPCTQLNTINICS